jgi:hypothetical protein
MCSCFMGRRQTRSERSTPLAMGQPTVQWDTGRPWALAQIMFMQMEGKLCVWR